MSEVVKLLLESHWQGGAIQKCPDEYLGFNAGDIGQNSFLECLTNFWDREYCASLEIVEVFFSVTSMLFWGLLFYCGFSSCSRFLVSWDSWAVFNITAVPAKEDQSPPILLTGGIDNVNSSVCIWSVQDLIASSLILYVIVPFIWLLCRCFFCYLVFLGWRKKTCVLSPSSSFCPFFFFWGQWANFVPGLCLFYLVRFFEVRLWFRTSY